MGRVILRFAAAALAASPLRMIIAILLAAAGCARAPEFASYSAAAAGFTVEVPKDWLEGPGVPHKPVLRTSFYSGDAEFSEGYPLGPVLHVTKFYRRAADHPGDAEAYAAYREYELLPSDVLFGGDASALSAEIRRGLPKEVRDTQLSGLPAKTFTRSWTENSGPLHGSTTHALRLEDVVVRTPEAYYVLEYRAPAAKFDRHYYAFKQAAATFRLREAS